MIDAVFKTWSGDDLNIGVFWHGIKTKACSVLCGIYLVFNMHLMIPQPDISNYGMEKNGAI